MNVKGIHNGVIRQNLFLYYTYHMKSTVKRFCTSLIPNMQQITNNNCIYERLKTAEIASHARRVMNIQNSRGATEFVLHSACRGSSLRRKGVASLIIDMVWLYRWPVPVGRMGVLYFYLSSRRLEEGEGGVSILWPY